MNDSLKDLIHIKENNDDSNGIFSAVGDSENIKERDVLMKNLYHIEI